MNDETCHRCGKPAVGVVTDGPVCEGHFRRLKDPTKRRFDGLQPFTVLVSFTGECCPHPHLWSETVRAATEDAARDAVLAEMRGQNLEPHDYAVLPGTHPATVIKEV